jgi:uncharacterized protein (TIGR03435 family)
MRKCFRLATSRKYTPSRFYPSLFTAIQEQLGLKLQETRTVGDVLVIDHVEKPSMNR